MFVVSSVLDRNLLDKLENLGAVWLINHDDDVDNYKSKENFVWF